MLEDALKTFSDGLYKFITCNHLPNSQCTVIIRKHCEGLHKHGDFSFPVEVQPWLPHFSREIFASNCDIDEHFQKRMRQCELIEESKKWHLSISSAKEDSKRIIIFLDRHKATNLAILQCLNNYEIMKSLKCSENVKVTTDDVDKIANSLTSYRVRLLKNVVENLVNLNKMKDFTDLVITARSSCRAPVGTQTILCGAVLNMKTSAKEINITVDKYIGVRQNEMTLVAQHKYGLRKSSDSRWRDLVSKLGVAAVKYELLQTRPGAAVKINFDNPTAGCSKGAAFVLYNCARVDTLLRTFHEKVESGQYPQPPQHADLALLTDEDEWALLFNYVLYFPSVVRACLRSDGAAVAVAPHLLCGLLSSLARTFSQYYRRVRILTEARAHLMPVLFARVQLLKALQIIFKTSLHILDIDFVSSM